MNTYGYEKLSVRKLTDELEPDTTSPILEVKGEKKKGAVTTFDLTGLTKEPIRVYGSNIEYYVVRKGVGQVAANFGLLDFPYESEGEVLGYSSPSAGIQGIGKSTEPPYYAAVAEAEDLYGEPVAFALVAGSFSKDGVSLATTTDEDFKPEAGEYVYTAISKDITIGAKSENFTVLRALGSAAVTELKAAVLGSATTP